MPDALRGICDGCGMPHEIELGLRINPPPSRRVVVRFCCNNPGCAGEVSIVLMVADEPKTNGHPVPLKPKLILPDRSIRPVPPGPPA